MSDFFCFPILRAVLAVATVLVGVSCVAPSGASSDGVELQQGAALDVCATAPEGALCDDKNVCTVFDVCKAGVCKGSAAPDGTLCTDGNVCTINDSCRVGACKGDAVPDLTACTDGDPCTVGDACKTGVCLPGAGMLACNDGIACTLDVCVPGAGCIFAPVGDCSIPKDAGPATDVKPPMDTAVDMMMSGGDVATDRLALPDVAPSDVRTDVVVVDAPAPVDAPKPVDAPIMTMTDGGTNEVPIVVVDADVDAAASDADANTVDAPVGEDAMPGSDASPVPTLPVLRASGGACACEAGAGAPGSTSGALGLLAVMLTLARRKTGGSRRGR